MGKANREKEDQGRVRVSLNFLSFPPFPSVIARLLSFPLLAHIFRSSALTEGLAQGNLRSATFFPFEVSVELSSIPVLKLLFFAPFFLPV